MNAKPLFVLLFFSFLIIIFIGGAIGDTDLTPDTPPALKESNSPGAFGPLMQSVQYGICNNPYIVRSGDTLSGIARACDVNLRDLLAANPQIENPDLIHVDQQVNLPIYATSETLPVVSAPVQEQIQPTETAAPVELVEKQAAAPAEQPPANQQQDNSPAPAGDAITSVFETARASGDGREKPAQLNTPQPPKRDQTAAAGEMIEVVVLGLPPNAPVKVGIGRVDSEPSYFDERITTDWGDLTVAVNVPSSALPGELWTVTVITMDAPLISVTAEPFTIDR